MRLALLMLIGAPLAAQQPATGIFDGRGDVGVTPKAGSVEFTGGEYRVTGGGANTWAADDAFYFVWKRVTGDVTLSADVRFEGAGTVAHRKAVLMVRQDLTPGSAYADVAVHGDGLTSLQFRPTAGAPTEEIKSTITGPVRIRIQRNGNSFTISAGKPGDTLTPTGPRVAQKGPHQACAPKLRSTPPA